MNRRTDILSLVLVSIVALLIWLVAEDYTSEDTSIQTRLGFTPTNTRHYVVEPAYTEVTLQLGGPNRAITKMQALLQNESLAITSPAGNGPHTFEDLAAQIRALPGNPVRLSSHRDIRPQRKSPARPRGLSQDQKIRSVTG